MNMENNKRLRSQAEPDTHGPRNAKTGMKSLSRRVGHGKCEVYLELHAENQWWGVGRKRKIQQD